MSNPRFLSQMLASGGDARIRVGRGSNTNIYGASPFPRTTLGYSASTANDISLGAFAHLEEFVARWPAGAVLDAATYRDRLNDIRARLSSAWGLSDGCDIVFAPSGTDLEFAALALGAGRSGRPLTNILLGTDEVGSGCATAAAGRYFAESTAVAGPVRKGAAVAGLENTALVSIPLRDAMGIQRESAAIVVDIDAAVRAAKSAGRHVLVHAVHGSKTGLVLPSLAGIDCLLRRHGPSLSLVVDACQARLEGEDLRDWLNRGAMVMMTGSKFIGGPPFSGFLLVPPALRPEGGLPRGLANLFRRAEWPFEPAICGHLADDVNPGLLLRLEAAMYEMERYRAIDEDRRERVIVAFGSAVQDLAARLGVPLVEPGLAGPALQHTTLATLDLSALPNGPDLAMTQRWCRVLAARGLRLGQPVRWRRTETRDWAGNLRVSLSMPLIAELALLEQVALDQRLARDMGRIADVLESAQRPVVA